MLPQIPLLLLLLFLQFSLLSPATLPNPDPAAIQLSLLFPTSAPPATISAFLEQSNIIEAACPLDLPDDIFPAVSTACSTSAPDRLPFRSRCCPALTAWLYAAYFATTLAARPLPVPPSLNLSVLSNDFEASVGGIERALHDRGIRLPHINGTCDAAYYYCGIRLRRLTCAGGASGADGW